MRGRPRIVLGDIPRGERVIGEGIRFEPWKGEIGCSSSLPRPPEVALRQEQARQALGGAALEGEVEGRRQEQCSAVGEHRRVVAAPKHVARAVPGIPDYYRVARIAVGEPVPGGEAGGVGSEDVAIL